MTGRTYKAAGVDIDAGAALVDAIGPLAKATRRPGADGALGGFGGLFDPAAAGYRDPILVAATDGVGTKVKLAVESGHHDTVGIDLVAMCVNDLIVQGAEPLFFLDYFASAHLDVGAARDVVAGIAEGCQQAHCALIGGETAEMPGLYAAGDYDLAGFAVGAMERGTGLDGRDVAAGDIVLGLASNGVHANGFSLVRKVAADLGLLWTDPAPFDPGQALGAALLAPTRIYVRACLPPVRAGQVKALAHITGGGLPENLPRVLPEGLGARLDAAAWPRPAVFDWLHRAGEIAAAEMLRTFNCGIGMAAVVAPDAVESATAALADAGETVHRIGTVTNAAPDTPRVTFDNLETAWQR